MTNPLMNPAGSSPGLPPPPGDPATTTPVRTPNSVRRTSHLDMIWPHGRGGEMLLRGGARDLATAAGGIAMTVGEASVEAEVDTARRMRTLEVSPSVAEASRLVGARGGAGFRQRLQEVLPEECAAGTPLYFLLDDVPIASLIGGFAWRTWPLPEEQWHKELKLAAQRDMTDICSGFRADGEPAVRQRAGVDLGHNLVPAVDPADPADPLSWHEMPGPPDGIPCMRRRRRVDVRLGDQGYVVDAMFRDAAWDPEGTEIAVHEYSLEAVVDPGTMTLADISARPRVLPFAECPAAAGSAGMLRGQKMSELRTSVLQTIIGTVGCTHLNDMLRALAEVPVLAARLSG